ncbi:MAG: hypothetical protein MHM6MM_000677 [Cercozoa sp. M6MM]
MGALLSWLNSFWEQEMEIAVLGIEGAGKSTFVQLLQTGDYDPGMIPTVGFNMYKVTKGRVQIKVWDLGGQKRFRSMWERYCRCVDSIVFMVDSCQPDLLEAAKEELHALMQRRSLEGIPLLVLANKNDKNEALAVEEIVDMLDLRSIDNREVTYYSISCKDKVNIDVTVDWLIKHSK